MAARPIKRFDFREFLIIVGQDQKNFVAHAFDKQQTKLFEVSATTLEEVEKTAKERALEISQDFIGFNEAMKLFTKLFPERFSTLSYLKEERDYKLKASALAASLLAKSSIDTWLKEHDAEALRTALKKVLQSTNICSVFEKAKFNDFIAEPSQCLEFSKHLRQVLYPENSEDAFQNFASYLNDNKPIRSWTIATYYPFLINPKEFIFLKPDIFKNAAHRLGYQDSYRTDINLETFQAQQSMAKDLLEKMKPLGAADMIDVQSFMYVVASEAYAGMRAAGEASK